MQELIAIIASTVIGVTVILILAVIAWRGQNHTTSSAQYSAAKAGLLSFAEVVEEDFGNMGAGQSSASMRTGFGGFTGLSSFDSTVTATDSASFEFYSWTDRDASVGHVALDPNTDYERRIRYTWSETGSARVFDYATNAFVTTPTYVIRRFVADGPGASFVPAGSSIDTLTEIEFEFFNVNGGPVNVAGATSADTLRSVRAIEIALAAVSPLGGGTGYADGSDPAQRGKIDQTRWVRRFRPPNLIRVTN
ncbi:MAG: hypothetical protein AAGI91_15125 [Bacteroidota bacterium]